MAHPRGATALVRGVLALVSWALCTGTLAQTGWTAKHFEVALTPDFTTQTIAGTTRIDFTVQNPTLSTITLDAGELEVQSVQQGNTAVAFRKEGAQLHISLGEGARRPAAGRTGAGSVSTALQSVTVAYRGKGGGGLSFVPQAMQVATAFSTSTWMPCLNDPSVRATFTLSLTLPEGLVSVGNGVQLPHTGGQGATVVHRWRLDLPIPSYLYGFAAGKFVVREQTLSGTQLQYAGPAPFTPDTLQQVFTDTADMLDFYADKAGVAYPLPSYRQVLLDGPAAQEMAGFSVMGVRYGARVLTNPQAIWLGAHEAAHQWWGNGVTNRSWRHFWLNEGIATFMTAAYLEHRFGRDEYMRQIEAARTKVNALREAGLERSLVFPDWDRPSSADRSLVYDKGALVMDALRSHLGEDAFWKALKDYTRLHWGRSVETEEFQGAFKASTGQDLREFFNAWVYLKPPADGGG